MENAGRMGAKMDEYRDERSNLSATELDVINGIVTKISLVFVLQLSYLSAFLTEHTISCRATMPVG